jgi:hypothetical protein
VLKQKVVPKWKQADLEKTQKGKCTLQKDCGRVFDSIKLSGNPILS